MCQTLISLSVIEESLPVGQLRHSVLLSQHLHQLPTVIGLHLAHKVLKVPLELMQFKVVCNAPRSFISDDGFHDIRAHHWDLLDPIIVLDDS